MTISKGTALTITTSPSGFSSIANFSSIQAGVIYGKPGFGGIMSGFLLDISGTTITKAGSEADLHTAASSPFQKELVVPVSSTNLRAITIDNADTVELTPITKTATELAGGTPHTLTWPDVITGSFNMTGQNWDGDTLVAVFKDTSPFTIYLTLGDDSSQGNVVSFSPSPTPLYLLPAFAAFDSTSGILVYFEGTTNDFMGVPLTKSGLTLSAGSKFQIDATDYQTLTIGQSGATSISSTRVATGYIDVNGDRRLRTIDSPTTVNASTVVAASDFIACLAKFHGNSVLLYSDDQSGTTFWSEFVVGAGGGLTYTNTLSESGVTQGHGRQMLSWLENSKVISAFGDSGTLKTIIITTDVDPPAPPTPERIGPTWGHGYSLSGMGIKE